MAMRSSRVTWRFCLTLLSGAMMALGIGGPRIMLAEDWDTASECYMAPMEQADHFDTGPVSEEENVAIYDGLLALELPGDVRSVFTSLRATSLDNHAVAFAECAEDPGDPIGFDPEATLKPALQDEFRMHFTYAKVLTDLGAITPFSNMVLSEGQHVAALAGLFTSRGLEVPSSDWNQGNVPTYGTRAEACAAAALGEQANVDLYDTLLALELPGDVATVFSNLRSVSLEKHLPALMACAQ